MVRSPSRVALQEQSLPTQAFAFLSLALRGLRLWSIEALACGRSHRNNIFNLIDFFS
jgi:hypothetical protein